MGWLLVASLRRADAPEADPEGALPSLPPAVKAGEQPTAMLKRGTTEPKQKTKRAKSAVLTEAYAATRIAAENDSRSLSNANDPGEAGGVAEAEAIRRVEEWEAMVDDLSEIKIAPTADLIMQTRSMFMGLNKADQMDAVTTALHLLPDEQFPVLYGLLFDKTQDFELLDEIFSDALNRPEEIKVPLMRLLMDDKAHPLAEEAERILDATGELDDDLDDDEN